MSDTGQPKRLIVVEVQIVNVRLGKWQPSRPPADPEIGETTPRDKNEAW